MHQQRLPAGTVSCADVSVAPISSRVVSRGKILERFREMATGYDCVARHAFGGSAGGELNPLKLNVILEAESHTLVIYQYAS